MKTCQITAILAMLGTVASQGHQAFASSDDRDDGLTALCTDLSKVEPLKAKDLFKSFGRLKFDMGYFAEPVATSVAPKERVRATVSSAGSEKNVIYVYSSAKALENDPELKAELEAFHRAQEEYAKAISLAVDAKLYPKARKSIADCVTEASRQRLNVASIMGFDAAASKLWRAKGIEETKEIRSEIRFSARTLTRPWIIKTGFDSRSLLRDLLSGNVENAVIVAHADATGQIFDSRGNTLPSSFFKHLHPAVRSISIFSCKGNAVRGFYAAKESLADSPSIHAERLFITPVSGDFLGIRDVVPAETIGYFLVGIERLLTAQERKQNALPRSTKTYEEPETCILNFRGIEQKPGTGDLGVFINDSFIGLFRPVLKVRCDLLNEFDDPLILIANQSAIRDSDATITGEPRLLIFQGSRGPELQRLLTGALSHRKNGTLSMARFE